MHIYSQRKSVMPTDSLITSVRIVLAAKNTYTTAKSLSDSPVVLVKRDRSNNGDDDKDMPYDSSKQAGRHKLPCDKPPLSTYSPNWE